MAGEHKCTVCGSTFTRPQHVARHMRSHTGDRPYRCQYCGDQFARSDLLSRHVNKCHSNEQPLPPSGTRRKGSASASRATTSKQACDFCVENSLPCDGSNPCAQCIKRKQKCTFIKFHRQTAPIGPGHNLPVTVHSSSHSSSPSSRLPTSALSHSRFYTDDNFIVNPTLSLPPGHTTSSQHHVPSTMGEALYASDSFAFQPLYPQQPPPSSPALSMPKDTADFTSRFRQDAEVLRQEQALYAAPNIMNTQPARSPPPWTWDSAAQQQQQQQHPRSSSVPGYSERGGIGSLTDEKHSLPLSSFMSQPPQAPITSASDFQRYMHRRQSLESMVNTAQSQRMQGLPSSYHQHRQPPPTSPGASSRSSSRHSRHSSTYSTQDENPSSDVPPMMSTSEFHAAFGQLSLELPGGGGTGPFFSSHSPMDDVNATPMPASGSELQYTKGVPDSTRNNNNNNNGSTVVIDTPTEALWQQFITTPSGTGPGPTNGGGYRRQRVASLPSPPTAAVDRWISHPGSGMPSQQHQQGISGLLALSRGEGGAHHEQGQGQGAGAGQAPTEYKLAVLDRAPVMNLKLGPRARRGTVPAAATATTSAGSPPSTGVGRGGSVLMVPPATQSISRPGSAASSSSLANVFGGQPLLGSGSVSPTLQHPGAVREGERGGVPLPLSASVSEGGEGMRSMRPAVKRGPSQVLEPGSTKRALVLRGDDEGPVVRVGVAEGRGAVVGEGRRDDRGMVTLAERRRRMSVPGSGVAFTFGLGSLPPG